jgi:Tol biopolymer transport system component
MKRTSILIVLLLCLPLGIGSAALQSGYDLFQKALMLERADGNLQEAIKLYQQIVEKFAADRKLAAQTLLRMGQCYETLGQAGARKAYERVLSEYADQSEQVLVARAKLVALRKPAPAESGPITRRVWAGPKTDFFGAVSPDGKYISFVDWDTGDLAVRDLEKGTNRRLTNKGSWESVDAEVETSIWSPDSRQVAYQWFQWETEPSGYELRLISLDSPTPRILYRDKNSADWIVPFDWSPDGKQILAVLTKEEGNQEMVLVSVADGNVRLLKRLSQNRGLAGAAISPDGRYVLYDYPQSESSLSHDIFLLPIGGGTETLLVEYPADDLVLGWASDGKWVLFSSDRRDSIDVWAIRTEDGKPQGAPLMVKPAVGRITPLGFTRSGSFYFGIGGTRNDIYVAKLDPNTGDLLEPTKKLIYVAKLDPNTGDLLEPTKKLIKQFEGFNRSPRYSPDGKYLAYISEAGTGHSLFIRSLETGEEREYQSELTRAGARTFSQPRWSPDGKSILLFGQDSRVRYGIYHLDLETGMAVNVLRSRENLLVGLPAGWRNARCFIYPRGDEKNDRGEICVRDLHTGSEKVIFSLSPAVNGAAYVSPDRKWVSITGSYQSGETSLRDLRIISTNSGEVRRHFKFSKGEGPGRIRHAWSADSKYVLYLKTTSDKWEVWRISVDSGQMLKTGLETPTVIDNLSAHPDGKRLAFEHWGSKRESPPEVWVMENFLPAK